MVGVVPPAVTQVDAADEGDVELGPAWVAQHHELLVVRAAGAHPHVEQALATGQFDVLAEVPVLGGAERELVQVGAPDEPAYVGAAAGRLAQHPRNGAVGLLGEALIGVAAPVGEQQQVASSEPRHAPDQLGEVGGPVHQRRGGVAGRPGQPVGAPSVQARCGVAALGGAEEPLGNGHGPDLLPRLSPHRVRRMRVLAAGDIPP